jgi:hypothetical protein
MQKPHAGERAVFVLCLSPEASPMPVRFGGAKNVIDASSEEKCTPRKRDYSNFSSVILQRPPSADFKLSRLAGEFA